MNYAVDGLRILCDAGIPAVAIEGNHDQKHTDTEYSWLRSLSKWGLLKLLEPVTVDSNFVYEEWNDTTKKGGYIDIGQARIFGSEWYGASANWAIPMLIEAIKANRRADAFHILMLHTDVEGHQMHPIPALSLSALKELKSVVDYVALGHTHKHYEIDNWAFNPGSIEITNITEFRETRGVFLVEVDDANNISAEHIQDYHFRPFQQLVFPVTGYSDAKEITADLLDQIRREARVHEEDKPRPIIEIALRGQLGFPNSTLEMQKMRDETLKRTGALHVRIKNQTVPKDYLETPDENDGEGRDQLERRVIEDLVRRDNRYKMFAEEISNAVIGAKRMALSEEPAEKIAEFIAMKACPKP